MGTQSERWKFLPAYIWTQVSGNTALISLNFSFRETSDFIWVSGGKQGLRLHDSWGERAHEFFQRRLRRQYHNGNWIQRQRSSNWAKVLRFIDNIQSWEIEKIVGNISSSSSSEAGRPLIQAPITLCGRVINAIIWEEQLWNLIQREHIINIGSFVRLRNVNKARLPTLATTNCK